MTIVTDEKQVAEDYIAQFDFSLRLLAGETINGVTSITATNEGLVSGSSNVVVSALAHNGEHLAQGKVSGGTHLERYLLTCFVTTSAGSTLESEMRLVVRNKP